MPITRAGLGAEEAEEGGLRRDRNWNYRAKKHMGLVDGHPKNGKKETQRPFCSGDYFRSGLIEKRIVPLLVDQSIRRSGSSCR